VLEDPLHIALAVVGSDDLLVGPTIPGGDDDPFAEEILRRPPVGVPVDLPAEIEPAVNGLVDGCPDQLVASFTLQDVLDLLLDVCAVSFPGRRFS